MNIKMDLSEKGLQMFFKDYQIDALKAIWEHNELNSRQVWEAVGSDRISRASIINFLEDAVENGLLEKYEVTGKGGHRGIYRHKYTEPEFKQHIAEQIFSKLFREYPEASRKTIKK